MLRLGVNIDHVATVRNARGTPWPDPLRAALMAEDAGADGITAHLREDRRHISDDDIARLAGSLRVPLNLEMAATPEMQAIALRHRPHAVCLVPEKREERTTEGGLDAAGQFDNLQRFVGELGAAGIRVSLFIEPEPRQIDAALRLGAPVVELHTGRYAHLAEVACEAELKRLADAAGFYRYPFPAEYGGRDGSIYGMAVIREHLARRGLGLHNDLQNEHSIVANNPFVVMFKEFATPEQYARDHDKLLRD